MVHAASEAGIPVHRVQPSDLRGYCRIFKSTQPDVAYFFGRIRTLGWILAAKSCRVKCLVGAERSSATEVVDWVARMADRWLLDGYITNSELAARNLSARVGISRDRVFVVRNGIASPVSTELVPHVEPHGNPLIVCVGSISPNKGQGVLLQAVAELRSEFPSIRVLFIGRDDTHGAFQREADRQGFGDVCEMTGFLPDITRHLASADLFALPSLHREGTPTSILEAMLHGVPVVASRIGGVEEIVTDGVTGILIDPGDHDALVDRLRWVLGHPAESRTMSERAKRYVRDHHSVEQMVQGHINAFGVLAQ